MNEEQTKAILDYCGFTFEKEEDITYCYFPDGEQYSGIKPDLTTDFLFKWFIPTWNKQHCEIQDLGKQISDVIFQIYDTTVDCICRSDYSVLTIVVATGQTPAEAFAYAAYNLIKGEA